MADRRYLRIIVNGAALSTGEVRTRPVINVYDFYRISLSGTPVKTQAITAFKTSVLTPLAACLSVSYSKSTIQARFLDDVLDPFVTVNDGVDGTVAGDSLPSLNNVYLKLATGFRRGSNRGAKRYGPIAESHTTLDHLTSAAVTLWGTFSAALLAGFTEATSTVAWLPFLVSAKKSTLRGDTATVVGNPVTSTVLDATLGKLSSRYQQHKSSV